MAAIRILLVEDDNGHARLLQELLRDAPGITCSVERAVRLAEGLKMGVAMGADLVMLDLSLPDGFGVSTLRKVAERLPGVPVLVLSSNDDTSVADEIRRAGASDYLVKGQFDSDILAQAIRAALKPRDKQPSPRT